MQSATSDLDPNRARRAIGAMFFFIFGAVWIEYYAFRIAGMRPLISVTITLISLILLFIAYRRYRQHKPALLAESPSPQ